MLCSFSALSYVTKVYQKTLFELELFIELFLRKKSSNTRFQIRFRFGFSRWLNGPVIDISVSFPVFQNHNFARVSEWKLRAPSRQSGKFGSECGM